MVEEVSLAFETDESPAKTLLLAFSTPGMAGVTASEYVRDQLALDQTGHVQIDGLPPITPFENGRPYHHTRLYSGPAVELTVLTSELPIPLTATDAFGRDLLGWVLDNDVREVTILLGIGSFGDGRASADEGLYFVASDDYRERHLEDSVLTPLTRGFLDGINASLVSRAIDTPLRVGVLATPVRTALLDGGAALRLVRATDSLYGLGIDTGQLERFAEQTSRYFEQLARRFEAHEGERPWDQAYM